MRGLLKLILAVLSLIPLYFAVTGMLGGAGVMNDGGAVTNKLDNQYRYLSAYYLSLFFLIWYVLGNLEERGAVLKLLILTVFIGGLARLYSYMTVGPATFFETGGMVLELGAPVLILLYHLAMKQPNRGSIA